MHRFFCVGSFVLILSIPFVAGVARGESDESATTQSSILESSAPISSGFLTLEEALEIALSNGFSVTDARLVVESTSENISAAKTRRLPFLEAFASQTRHLTNESYRYEAGAFGSFPSTGPIPASELEIQTQQNWATVAGASATLPLTQQYQIALTIDQEEVAHGLASEDLRFTRQRLAKQVKDTYYTVIETRAAIAATEEAVVFLGHRYYSLRSSSKSAYEH